MTFKEGVKEASPVNLHNIGEKTHVTVELGMLIRGIVIIAMAVAGYMNFMVWIDRMEVANNGLKKQLVVRDSLMRKDVRATLNALHKDITTNTAKMVTALGNDIGGVKISLINETAAMVATTKSSSEKIAIELDNLKGLIVAANSTTHAELQPAIKNVQNALDIQMEALNKRINLIEGQVQEQVKRSFLDRFKK